MDEINSSQPNKSNLSKTSSLSSILNGDNGGSMNGNSANTAISTVDTEPILPGPPPAPYSMQPAKQGYFNLPASAITLMAIASMILGLAIDNVWLGYGSAILVLTASLAIIWPNWGKIWTALIPPVWRSLIIASFGILASMVGLLILSSTNQDSSSHRIQINWDAIGALGELIGALGQIMIAILGVYVAWRQYVISRDLTLQQNRITQQQTIDAYFQGVSDLAMDEQGFLEDWPQERAIAEGRTAAILSSVDAEGKAKILRFLSQSKLVTPIKRDKQLGRPILDGHGGYEEDRDEGIRVIDLGVMLAGADLANMDLRWTDLSDANLVRGNLSNSLLVKANLARTILFDGNLSYADLKGTQFFYGNIQTATPRSRSHIPNYETGMNTGAVVENINFTGVKRLSEEQRHYCCAWCGERSRKTIPGGCDDIPNKLGR